jgi:hypothetical protein
VKTSTRVSWNDMEGLASTMALPILLFHVSIYIVARQLAFRSRRDDALMVLRFMLLGYHQSPTLFNNVAKGLIPLLVNCRKTPVSGGSLPTDTLFFDSMRCDSSSLVCASGRRTSHSRQKFVIWLRSWSFILEIRMTLGPKCKKQECS